MSYEGVGAPVAGPVGGVAPRVYPSNQPTFGYGAIGYAGPQYGVAGPQYGMAGPQYGVAGGYGMQGGNVGLSASGSNHAFQSNCPAQQCGGLVDRQVDYQTEWVMVPVQKPIVYETYRVAREVPTQHLVNVQNVPGAGCGAPQGCPPGTVPAGSVVGGMPYGGVPYTGGVPMATHGYAPVGAPMGAYRTMSI